MRASSIAKSPITVALIAALAAQAAQASSFNYHGTLNADGKPAEGNYDLMLTLYSAKTGGSVVAGPVTLYGVPVHLGRFNTDVDFGATAPIDHSAYLDVQVKSSASSAPPASLASRAPVASPDGTCPAAWTLDGNAANPAGSFLGTVDANDVDVYSNSVHAANFSAASAGVTLSPFAGFYALGEQSTAVSYSNGTAASATYSFAGGYSGGTVNPGSFVWGDFGGGASPAITDSAADEFVVQAHGGVGINTSLAADGGPLAAELTIAHQGSGLDTDIMLTQNDEPPYLGFDIFAQENGYFGIDGMYDNGGTLAYEPVLYVNYVQGSGGDFMLGTNSAAGALTVGNPGGIGNGAFLSFGGTWTNASSRSFKDGFAAIDPMSVLAKLVAMPVQTWFYKDAHVEGQHMGPVAEDFAATFGLGADDKHITTVDESGVALAAIQGLDRKVEIENAARTDETTALERRTDAVAAENVALRQRIDELAARLAKIESH